MAPAFHTLVILVDVAFAYKFKFNDIAVVAHQSADMPMVQPGGWLGVAMSCTAPY